MRSSKYPGVERAPFALLLGDSTEAKKIFVPDLTSPPIHRFAKGLAILGDPGPFL